MSLDAARQSRVEDPLTHLMRGRASLPEQGAAALLMAVFVMSDVRRGVRSADNAILVNAAHMYLGGTSPYEDRRFLYLPSSALLAAPQTLLDAGVLRVVVPVVVAALVLVGWFFALRIFDVSARSRLAVYGVGGLPFFVPFRSELALGNWTVFSVVALPLTLFLASRGRWLGAAAATGAAIAFKPMLLPVLLLFVFARKWKACAVLLGVPVVVSLIAVAFMPQPGLFLTKTIPFLLHGQDSYAKPYDASLISVLPRLGVPEPVAYVIAVTLSGAVLYLAWLRWRRAGDPALRVVETACLLMLATFPTFRPTFVHYALVVVLVLLASTSVPGAAARSPWVWLPLVPQITAIDWPLAHTSKRHAFKDAVMFVGVGVALAWHCFSARPSRRAPEKVPIGSGPG
ncbi:glycosyltransferase family 87 protein [Streptomyces sp. NPDC046821]|uniref:glycosyltransferase family 87 protein n=1 Tax=Streptomyces sp. NPDC046821 TaxID=3154702 RepID=UPI00340E1CE4